MRISVGTFVTALVARFRKTGVKEDIGFVDTVFLLSL